MGTRKPVWKKTLGGVSSQLCLSSWLTRVSHPCCSCFNRQIYIDDVRSCCLKCYFDNDRDCDHFLNIECGAIFLNHHSMITSLTTDRLNYTFDVFVHWSSFQLQSVAIICWNFLSKLFPFRLSHLTGSFLSTTTKWWCKPFLLHMIKMKISLKRVGCIKLLGSKGSKFSLEKVWKYPPCLYQRY